MPALLTFMKVRIGRGLDGSPVSLDTTRSSVLLLVGDPGRGKTTLARYLARWWTADPPRTARVFTDQPHQYADLRLQSVDLSAAFLEPTSSPQVLTIVDGADSLPPDLVRAHATAPGLTLLTSYAATATAVHGSGHLCLGLLAHDQQGELPPGRWHRPLEADDLQGRLDWPSNVVPVIPDVRGDIDFPRHRWQLMAGAAG